MYMKSIQIMMDEELLIELDADEEVRKSGRSAVLRRIVAEYIERRRRQSIADRYREAYGEAGKISGTELDGWEDEGVWPSE
jgi:metal-responsive CopG/Arc/MetJ family transcriptional regulator